MSVQMQADIFVSDLFFRSLFHVRPSPRKYPKEEPLALLVRDFYRPDARTLMSLIQRKSKFTICHIFIYYKVRTIVHIKK